MTDLGTLVLGLGGWALSAGPALTRMRRRHRLRGLLKHDIDLLNTASQAGMTGEGVTNLQKSVEAGLNELVEHEQELRRKALARRGFLRRIFAFLVPLVGLVLSGIALQYALAEQTEDSGQLLVVILSVALIGATLGLLRTVSELWRLRKWWRRATGDRGGDER